MSIWYWEVRDKKKAGDSNTRVYDGGWFQGTRAQVLQRAKFARASPEQVIELRHRK